MGDVNELKKRKEQNNGKFTRINQKLKYFTRRTVA